MSAPTITQQWVDAFNRHDPDAIAALYAPNAVVRDPQYPEALEGRDAIRNDAVEFFRTFPDLQVVSEPPILAGDIYAAEAKLVGTHRGALMTPSGELPATGKRMVIEGATIGRLDGQGRILEERRYYDVAGLIAQLSVAS